MRCFEDHEAIKRDDKRWQELPFAGIQPGWDDLPDLELRTCACGSTLAREVTKTKRAA